MAIRTDGVKPAKGRKGQFQQRLQQAGYTHDSQRFCCEVEALFVERFHEFKTDEQLKRHPEAALRFCNEVRTHFALPELPYDLILGGLENYRKHYKQLVKTAA